MLLKGCLLALTSILLIGGSNNGLLAQKSSVLDMELLKGFRYLDRLALSFELNSLTLKEQLEELAKQVEARLLSSPTKVAIDKLLELANSQDECNEQVMKLLAPMRRAILILNHDSNSAKYFRALVRKLPFKQCEKFFQLGYYDRLLKMSLDEQSNALLEAIEPKKVGALIRGGKYAFDWFLAISGIIDPTEDWMDEMRRFAWFTEMDLYPTLGKLAKNDPKFISFHEKTFIAPRAVGKIVLEQTKTDLEAKKEFRQLLSQYLYQPCRKYYDHFGHLMDAFDAFQSGLNNMDPYQVKLDIIWHRSMEFRVHFYKHLICRQIMNDFELLFDRWFIHFYYKTILGHRNAQLTTQLRKFTDTEQSFINFEQWVDRTDIEDDEPHEYLDIAKDYLFTRSYKKPDIKLAVVHLSFLARSWKCNDGVVETLAIIKSESEILNDSLKVSKSAGWIRDFVLAMSKDQCQSYFEARYQQLKGEIDRKLVKPLVDEISPNKLKDFHKSESTSARIDWFLAAYGNRYYSYHMPWLKQYEWTVENQFLPLIKKLADKDARLTKFLELREKTNHIDLVDEETLDDYHAKTALDAVTKQYVIEPCKQFTTGQVGQLFYGFQGYKSVFNLEDRFMINVDPIYKHGREFKQDFYNFLFCQWFMQQYELEFDEIFEHIYYKESTESLVAKGLVEEAAEKQEKRLEEKRSLASYIATLIARGLRIA